MKIGIIGSGKIGGAIGMHWSQHGHQVTFSNSSLSEKLENLAKQADENALTGTITQAAEFGKVILFAPPYWKTDEALAALKDAAKMEPHGPLYDKRLTVKEAQQLLSSIS